MNPLGINTNCLGRITIRDAVTVAKELGVDLIEIGPVVERDKQAFQDVQRNGPVKIHSLIYGRNFLTNAADHRREYRDHLRAVIDLAHDCEIKQITTATGVDSSLTLDENIEAALEFWGPIFEETAGAGIRIALEFCPTLGNFALGPYMWRKLFAATQVHANFGLNYDPAHLIWQMIDPYAPINEFAAKIFSVHAKDCFVDQDLLAQHGVVTPYRSLKTMPHGLVEEKPVWHEPRLPGDGNLSWDRFWEKLSNAGYAGAVILEHEDPRYFGSRELVVEGLRRGLTFLRGLLTEEKQLQQ